MEKPSIHRKEVKRAWWYRCIRSVNWFCYQYWWVVLILFLSFLLCWYLFCFKASSFNACASSDELNQRISSVNRAIDNCCDCNDIKVPNEGISFPADYLIITYQFDQEGGIDLDTRTRIMRPFSTDEIGFCKANNSSEFLIWSGDNRGYGVESCLVDLTRFKSNDRLEISCGAVWWEQRNSGNMSIDIRAYKGGTMSLKDFQFLNNGGKETAFKSFSSNISLNNIFCASNQIIGIISYDKQTEKLFFTPN